VTLKQNKTSEGKIGLGQKAGTVTLKQVKEKSIRPQGRDRDLKQKQGKIGLGHKAGTVT
jgi:hypothetical protein